MGLLRIKEIRLEKGLTIGQLASKSGVSSSMISNYENGTSDITLTKLLDIAEALDMNFWDLVEIKKVNGVKAREDIDQFEQEASTLIESLPTDLQLKILKLYILENRKTIKALQQSKIQNINDDLLELEEYVLENIALLSGKSQATEYRERLRKKRDGTLENGEVAG